MRVNEIVAIIPARLGSTRFPRKVLAAETGKPLIQYVWERARSAWSIRRVVIAVDDPQVEQAARGFGAECVMTRADHPNGTSRLAEAAKLLGLPDSAIVVNVQGDEPEMDPLALDAAASSLQESGADVATLASPFASGEDPSNPNIVKVVLSRKGEALYFSRSLIPFVREGGREVAPLKHIGVYVYRVGFLKTYAALASTPLEQCEMLEQLRVLEHGYRIAAAVYPVHTTGIDTIEQYRAFVERCKSAERPKSGV